MRSLLIIFAILLAILTLISSLGGSLNTTEKFYEDIKEEVKESFYQDDTTQEEEETSVVPEGPSDNTAVTPEPAPQTMSSEVEEFAPFEKEANYGKF